MSDHADDPSGSDVAPDSIRAQGEHRVVEGPTHPKMAATLLMVGIVVLLVAIAAAPLLGR